MEELENLWCLGDWAQETDYLLCEWDGDLLPQLFEKDEVRFEYNQWANDWSKVSCTIFAAMGMLSDLINYEFSEAELKEVDELSYTRGRVRWQWWFVQSAVKLVADWYNNSELSKKYWKVAYYRMSKFSDDVIENAINKLYTIDGNQCITSEYTKDKKDWMIDWTDFGKNTNWHSIDVINYKWQRSVKNSYKWSHKYNIYWLKNKLSVITNFWTWFYIYTLVKEDNYERIKELNEFKTLLIQTIENNSAMRHKTKDVEYQKKLNEMNNVNRKKLADIDEQLKLLNK